jgi:membrane protein DedA with SNARE-associated domain
VAAALIAFVGVVVLIQVLWDEVFGLLDGETNPAAAYAIIIFFVAADAVVPLFPAETTLSVGSTLASEGKLDLALVIVAGAIGAVAGDSALYWIARKNRLRVQPRVDRVKKDKRVAWGLDMMGETGPLIIVCGRFLPGLRFVVNASMGLIEMPYRSFLLWSTVGGILWSTSACVLSYIVATSLDDYPVIGVFLAGFLTTAIAGGALAFGLRHAHRKKQQLAAG